MKTKRNMKKFLHSFGSNGSRFCQTLLIVAAVLVGQNAWADQKYNSVEGTTVFYTTSSNITSWKTAGWATTGSSISSSTKTVYINPESDESIEQGSSYEGITVKKDNSSKKLIVYLTNVSEVKFYAVNPNSSNVRQIGVIVNDNGSDARTIDLQGSATNVLDITELNPATKYKFDIYGYESVNSKANDVFLYAIKAYGGSGSASDLAVSSECSVGVGASKELTYTTSSTGSVSVASNAEGVATASVDQSSKTVTITGVAAGTATITLSQAADATYAAGSKTISVTVTGSQPQPEDVTVNVSAAGIATIYSAYNLIVPADVEVYGYSYDSALHMLIPGTAITEGSILPKGKGFVVKASQGDYTFTGTNDSAGDYSSVLTGYTEDKSVNDISGKIYGFAVKNEKVGLYKFKTESGYSTIVPAGKAVYIK